MVRRFNANGEYVSKEQFCKICHLKNPKHANFYKVVLYHALTLGYLRHVIRLL